jgi:uncharacterized protein (DUF2141 family)
MPLPALQSSSRPRRYPRWAAALAAAVLTAAAPAARAADLVVRVGGLTAPLGSVGCSLFAGEAGFPMDNRRAEQQWLPAQADVVVCRFKGVAPGRYAVSVGHDRNGDQRVDTNFLGMPTEQWGVSNNVRPTLRAPRFEEAVFTIPADAAEWAIEIRVAS